MGAILCSEWDYLLLDKHGKQNYKWPIGGGLSRSARIRFLTYGKTAGYCLVCGCVISRDGFECDHFHPRSRGGSDGIGNRIPLCRGCNLVKSNNLFVEVEQSLAARAEGEFWFARNGLRLSFFVDDCWLVRSGIPASSE